jgi:hypothetical protein
MKGRLNNFISQYETERSKLKTKKSLLPAEERRKSVIDEVLKILYELRR